MSPTAANALPETEALRVRVTNALGRAGARVSDRELPEDFAALIEAHPIVMNHESARAMGWELQNAAEGLSEGLRERLNFGLSRSTAQVEAAYDVFSRTQAMFPEAMDGLDILITPSAPGEAPAGLEWTGDPSFNFIWTSLHVPCVTVPAGLGPNGMPLGIQIVGRRGEDKAVLAWAQWVASVIGN
jgi:Asp-tRNA(Asn)/Glu-tRNA(Gln) amidotransferase A subunit family amidase